MATPLHLLSVIFGLGLCWGIAFPLVSIANASAPVFTIVALRLVIAAVLLVLYRRWQKKRWSYSRAEAQSSLVLALIGSVIPFSLITWGQQAVASGAASLIISVVPILVLFLAHFTLHNEKITREKLLGTLLGFTGVLLLIIPDVQAASNGALLRYLAIAGASCCYAATHVYCRAQGQHQDNLSLATGSIVAGAALMLPIAWVGDGLLLSPITPQGWFAIILLGLLPSAAATILFFYTLRLGGTMLASYAGYLVPLYGVFLSALLLGEPLTLRLLAALTLVLLGMLFVQKSVYDWLRTALTRRQGCTNPGVDP